MAVTVDEIPELPPISNEADFPKEPLVLWIAEDDEDFREALRTSLARDSLNIRLFSDGQAVITVLERGDRFDLLLVDLKMPGVDGLGVLKHSKKFNPDGIVILMTGYATLDTAAQALQGGAYHYIRKPFKFAELEIILKHASERLRLERKVRALQAKLNESDEEIKILRSSLFQIRQAGEFSRNTPEQRSPVELLLRQLLPPDYCVENKGREKLNGLERLVQLRKEGFIDEAELISFKKILLES